MIAAERGERVQRTTSPASGKRANSSEWRRPVRTLVALAAAIGSIAAGSPAAAVTFDGIVYAGTSPVTGSCMVTGIPCQAGGATITCTGLNPSLFANLYFGIRNDQVVNGETMTGTAGPVANSHDFNFFEISGADTIRYTGTTTITDYEQSVTDTVDTLLQLRFQSGTGSLVAVNGNPANNSFGDVEYVWKVTATNFTATAELFAKTSTLFPSYGPSCPDVFDPTHALSQPPAVDVDRSNVDLGFYFEELCDPTPKTGCAPAGKALIKIKDSGTPDKKKVLFKWLKGTIASPVEFGDPVMGTTNYRLCFYENGTTLLPAPHPSVEATNNWSVTGNGYKYKSSVGNSKGVTKVALKAGAGNARILFLAKGVNVDVPTLPFAPVAPLLIQVVKDAGSGPECWEANFSLTDADDTTKQFKDKEP